MGYAVAVHTNTGLTHQVRIALALVQGFEAHGLSAMICDRDTEADLHVCLGPWFAFDKWRHANTLYIDRAYWGDPECVSVHWLRDGEKLRACNDSPRAHPEALPMRAGGRRIYLCDYGEHPTGSYDAFRRHPADGATGTLAQALEGFGVATGCRTTALVHAAIAGLRVESADPHSPIQGIERGREKWLTNLAWHNWSLDEIRKGEMWDEKRQN